MAFRWAKQNCQLRRCLEGSSVDFPSPPIKKVNYQSWLDSSLPPWHWLLLIHWLISLVWLSQDLELAPIVLQTVLCSPSTCCLVQFCCDFSKAGWVSHCEPGGSPFPFQHRELSAADSNYVQQWLTSREFTGNVKMAHFHHLNHCRGRSRGSVLGHNRLCLKMVAEKTHNLYSFLLHIKIFTRLSKLPNIIWCHCSGLHAYNCGFQRNRKHNVDMLLKWKTYW